MTILQKHLVFVPVCFVAFAVLFGVAVMLLWNWLMPCIFGLPEITFFQSVGLLVLCKILFGGISCGHHHGKHHCCHGDRNQLRERWESMSPEERKRIVELHKSICPDAKDGEQDA